MPENKTIIRERGCIRLVWNGEKVIVYHKSPNNMKEMMDVSLEETQDFLLALHSLLSELDKKESQKSS